MALVVAASVTDYRYRGANPIVPPAPPRPPSPPRHEQPWRADHGTDSGYYRHRRQHPADEPIRTDWPPTPCEGCRAGHAAAQRTRKARQNADAAVREHVALTRPTPPAPSPLRVGSLFSGYGGLDAGVRAALENRGCPTDLAWVSDVCRFDPKTGEAGHHDPHRAPCTILAHHHPGVPNLGDVTTIDWATVAPIDVLTGGFPCQDVSHAGKRLGLKPGTRSGLWSHMAYAIDQLRPQLVVAENVRGLLSAEAGGDLEPCPWCVGDGERGALRALGAVLGDLADLGYDAEWRGVRAADVGAPHGRFRVFVYGWTR